MQLFRIHYFVLSAMAENLIAREVLKNLVGCGKLLPRETAEPPRFGAWRTVVNTTYSLLIPNAKERDQSLGERGSERKCGLMIPHV